MDGAEKWESAEKIAEYFKALDYRSERVEELVSGNKQQRFRSRVQMAVRRHRDKH